MSLTLYLIRHGETTFSQSGGYCGNLDPLLTNEGAQMAGELAAAYAHIPFQAAYVSPMRRTIATATPLCEATGLTMNLRDGLKEIAYGEWEGKTQEYVKEHHREEYIRWLTEPAWNAPTGGETALEISSRASTVVSEIINEHHHGNVVLFSHKATIRIMLCEFLGIDLGRYRDRISALAGSVSVVQFGEYGPRLELLNDRSYMSAELRSPAGFVSTAAMRSEAETIAALSGTWQGEFVSTEVKTGPLSMKLDARRMPLFTFTARLLVLGGAATGTAIANSRFVLSGDIDDSYGRSLIDGFVNEETIEFNKRYVELRPEWRHLKFHPIAYRGKLSHDASEMSGEWTIATRVYGFIPNISIGRWKSARVLE